MTVIRLATVDDALLHVREMREAAACQQLLVDFSTVEYVKPIPTAIFARELRLLVASRSRGGLITHCVGLDESKSSALTYLADVGFFDFIGVSGCGEKVRAEAEVLGRQGGHGSDC